MIVKTEGIILHKIKYQDSSFIVSILTKDYGFVSCIMNNVRSKRSKSAFFEPLNIVNLEIYYNQNSQLHRIKTISFEHIIDFSDNIYKTTIAFFTSTFLYKLFKTDVHDSFFYEFIKEFTLFLNSSDEISNAHILLLLQLTNYLGIEPHNNYTEQMPYFNMQLGEFNESQSNFTITLEQSKVLHLLLQQSDFVLQNFTLGRMQRKEILDILIQYYNIHIKPIHIADELGILEEILS